MQNTINKIEELSSTLKKVRPMKAEFQKKLDRKFRLEFNYNSNHIEGNTLTYSETELLLIFDETKGNHTLREYEEMIAHDVALQLVSDWADDKERPLTEANIKNLNEVMLVKPFWKDAITPDGQKSRRLIKVGDYKEFPNSVQLSNGEIFEYASVTDTPILMGELIQWYRTEEQKNEFHPVALAAILHYKLVRIHPFDDGNGRISRLLMNYVLLKNNLPPVVIKSADKRNYLSALNSADAGDLNSFIKYIAQQLVWSLEISIKAANGESIEEPDDVEKEISIWKKQAAQNVVNATHRSDDLIYEIYTNGVQEMFEQFADKHKQFYDLFHKSGCYTYKNSGGQEGTQWLTDEIYKIVLNPKALFVDAGEVPELAIADDTFRNIFIQVNLQEYKYNETDPFTIQPRLMIEFHSYKYEVQYGNKKIEKVYGELLNADERKEIIADCLKAVFAEIKVKSGNGKH
ncbi:MAG: Fic family protein [Bacteroidota bacterium]|nr:Fic family protein [Bacteroidota bacterium]